MYKRWIIAQNVKKTKCRRSCQKAQAGDNTSADAPLGACSPGRHPVLPGPLPGWRLSSLRPRRRPGRGLRAGQRVRGKPLQLSSWSLSRTQPSSPEQLTACLRLSAASACSRLLSSADTGGCVPTVKNQHQSLAYEPRRREHGPLACQPFSLLSSFQAILTGRSLPPKQALPMGCVKKVCNAKAAANPKCQKEQRENSSSIYFTRQLEIRLADPAQARQQARAARAAASCCSCCCCSDCLRRCYDGG